VLQVLEAGLAKLGSRPVVHRINPKAMPRQQLLGSLNLDTREWTDGVLTAAARKVCCGCICFQTISYF
jgi:dynein heavy chain 2